MFVTQRGLLVAIPVGLLLLSTWREEWFRGGKPIIPRWAQWMLYATLPLFNLHAFLFASLVLLAIFTRESSVQETAGHFCRSRVPSRGSACRDGDRDVQRQGPAR